MPIGAVWNVLYFHWIYLFSMDGSVQNFCVTRKAASHKEFF